MGIVKGTLIIGGTVAVFAGLFGIAANNIGKRGIDGMAKQPNGGQGVASFLRWMGGVSHLEGDAIDHSRSFLHKSGETVGKRAGNMADNALPNRLNKLAAGADQLHQKYKMDDAPKTGSTTKRHQAAAQKTAPQDSAAQNEVRMLQDYTIPPYTSPGGVTIPQCTIPYGKQLPYDGTREVGGQTQYKVDIRSINCRGYSFQWVPKGTAISKQDAAKPPVQVQPLNKDGTNRQPYGKPVVRAKGPALNA